MPDGSFVEPRYKPTVLLLEIFTQRGAGTLVRRWRPSRVGFAAA